MNHQENKSSRFGLRNTRLCFATIGASVIAVLFGTVVAPAAQAATEVVDSPGHLPGWNQDFVDNFDSGLNTGVWGRYETDSPTQGKASEWDAANAFTENGSLVIRTHDAGGGDWRSGGVSSGPGFAAAQGKWAVRAKFDRAYGVSYAFLLYPQGGGWPPEVDFAEGVSGGDYVMSTLHWSSANLTDSRFNHDVDMTQWHTYGVILSDDKVEFTVDGSVWTTIDNHGSPRIPMWLGLQAGAKHCAGSTGECLSSSTPKDSQITIDWAAHWTAA